MDVLTHLMFQDGRAREAVDRYVSLLPDSRIERVDESGAIAFTLAGRPFIAFDSPVRHGFDFTPSTSIFVRCDDAEQVQSLFVEVADGGHVLMPVADYGFSSCFGWATDRYGVSWQVGVADRQLAPS
jgi:predicted 3-demethylubiquinone-9 3-methyltransferase (glyoxalase superfamily)